MSSDNKQVEVEVPDEFWDVLNDAIADGLEKLRRLELKLKQRCRLFYREAPDGRMILHVEIEPQAAHRGTLN